MGVGGGPLYGHGSLGEDTGFPELARNGAKAGTMGMLKAYANTGMPPGPIMAAIFGAAAVMEIVHPDSEVGEQYGEFMKTNSAYIAGLGAAGVAGLPKKLHIRGTGEEYDTARLVGDLGVILKDIGGPSVRMRAVGGRYGSTYHPPEAACDRPCAQASRRRLFKSRYHRFPCDAWSNAPNTF